MESTRNQRIVSNGIHSDWTLLDAGLHQGSVLVPLLFLVYVTDLTDNISSQMRLFADDSFLFTTDQTHERIERIHLLLTNGHTSGKWHLILIITKHADEIIFSVDNKKPNHQKIIFNVVPVAREYCTKHLGVHLDNRLNFSMHIREAILKAWKGINLLKYLSKFVNRKVLDIFYRLYVRPPASWQWR